jgi:branched-subunit amino acid transport protein AzlD
MKNLHQKLLDPYLIGGFNSGFFIGLLNPFFVTLILSHLNVRVLAIGSFLFSALPFFLGLILENKKIFDKLFKCLPYVMLAEVLGMLALLFLYRIDTSIYYVASMGVCGLLSASIIFLMQKVRDIRYKIDKYRR